MAETIDHQGGTAAAIQDAARRQETLLRIQMIDEVREHMLDEGPRSEGIVPTEEVKTLFHGLAEAAVSVMFRRLRVIAMPKRVLPSDCLSDETTQQTIDRLIKPELSSRLGDAMLSAGLVGVSLQAPVAGAMHADFNAVAFAVDSRPLDKSKPGHAPTSFLLGGGPVDIRGLRR